MNKEELLSVLRRQVRLLELEAGLTDDRLLSTDMRVDARYLKAAISNIERINSWITVLAPTKETSHD